MVAGIQKKEMDSFNQMWDNVQELAYDRLKLDIANHLLQHRKVNFNEVVYQTGKLSLLRPTVAVLSSEPWQGQVFQVPHSKYGKVSVKSVQFYVQSISVAGDSVLKVIDLDTGTELHSQAFTSVVGYNSIIVDKDFEVPHDNLKLYFRIDATNLSLYELQDYWWQDRWGAPVCGCRCECDSDWQGYAAEGSTTDPATTSTLTMFVALEVACSLDAFICDNIKHFTSAWQYLLGHGLMKQKLGTHRIGYWANSNLEVTASLRDSFYVDYSAHVKRVVQTIPLDTAGLCYNCDNVIGFKYDSLV